jgi:tetratricopeptide (TPR) repeat protein
MNILMWYLWLIPLIFVHECGHALVGRLVGFRVFWISIGYGRQIFESHILGVNIRINSIPFGGTTALAARTFAALRLRLWLSIFAGPATHLVWLGACYLIWGADFFRDRVLSLHLLSSSAPVETFIFANAFLLLINLFLKRPGGTRGLAYSDGYQLLRIPFLKEEEIAECKTAYVGLQALEYMRSEQIERAVSTYEDALRLNPQSYMLRHDLAVARLKQGDYQLAREAFAQLLESKETRQAERRMLLLNNIAWVNVILGGNDLLAEADHYSEEAIRFAPKVPSFMGTRGAVLIRTGRIREGVSLLKTAYRQHSDRSSRAAVACWIAIGAAMVGNPTESAGWLQKAREESPEYHLLDMTEREVKATLTLSEPLARRLTEEPLET